MPNLTEEQIAKLYPRAKTYDELQTEREVHDERRRPKLVAPKIALYTSLAVPVVAITYYVVQWIAARMIMTTTGATASMTVLAGFCFVILIGVTGLAALYYLWSLIDSLVSKAVANTSLLYLILAGTLCAASCIGTVLYAQEYGFATATLVPMLWTFLTSFMVTKKLAAH